MSYGPPLILVNDFGFCQHGLEYCHSCCVDHTMCNNIQLEDTLAEGQSEKIGVRVPIRTQYPVDTDANHPVLSIVPA